MENNKIEQNDKFKAKVKQILYPSSTSSSDDDCTAELPVLDDRPSVTSSATDASEAALRLLHKHEEFITKQLSAVRRMRQKGILTVSSKQSTDDLVENDEGNDVLKEEQLEASGEGASSRG